MHRILGCLFALSITVAAAASGDEPATGGFPWLDPTGVPGALVIHGGGELPDDVQKEFLELAGGDKARIVVIPTAGERADAAVRDDARKQRLLEPWKSLGAAEVQVLHTRSKDEANREAFLKPLKQATAVWFGGGLQQRIADAYLGTAVERELLALLGRGGVIGGTSAGAAIQSRVMIASGQAEPQMSTGFELLPGAIIDQHFVVRQRRDRLVAAVAQHPACVGYGIDEGTALVVRGRRMQVLGKSTVTVVLAECEGRPLREFELKAGESHDLTMLRRAALERSLANFPPPMLLPAKLENGALVIVGGGGMPASVVERFIELAGGPEAPIVVLPIAAGDVLSDRSSGETRLFERAGAKRVRSLRARTREEVESAEFVAALKEAKGVWFGGGRQWRFVDAYMGTPAEEMFRDVLRRGGVIGGSSAGASIQAQVMVRGSPLGNTDMLADGYERGLGFLPGAAVDQHFSQRRRQSDMLFVMRRYPQLLGIGIDEGTSLIVQGQTGEVLGRGNVHFYDGRNGDGSDEPAVAVAKPGERYDLVERTRLP